jgi:lipopolysaccharide transport system ATP-binding protein
MRARRLAHQLFRAAIEITDSIKPAPSFVRSASHTSVPAVFHVTHWKAGSQWIYRNLQDCAPKRIVAPQNDQGQFLHTPLQPGKIYPTVYVTSEQFACIPMPAAWRRFVVVRDLRDTLISAYFSFKTSHPENPHVMAIRKQLISLSKDAGLEFLMEHWLPMCAQIPMSWAKQGERLIHYEDLLEHDVAILEALLLDEFQLPIHRGVLRAAILDNRFEQLAHGRRRGQEDANVHERKGIAGDWRNHFDDGMKRTFKNHFGDLLIATGYEHDFNW